MIRRRAVWPAMLIVAAAFVLSSCVGTARTTGAYRGKVYHSATTTVSALETVLVAVQTSQKGNMLGAYLEVLVSKAEDTVDSVQQQFGSIQPPDTKEADQLQSQLNGLLTKAADTVSQIRIASRRDKQTEMVKYGADIPPLVKKLDSLARATS